MASTKKVTSEKYQDMEKRMNEIINKLSDESISLDEQLELGEEGKLLLDKMQKKLDEINARIEKITSEKEND